MKSVMSLGLVSAVLVGGSHAAAQSLTIDKKVLTRSPLLAESSPPPKRRPRNAV